MQLPLTFSDISFLLGVCAILLLLTAEFGIALSRTNDATINKKKLRNAAIMTGLLFLGTLTIQIINIVLSY